MLVTIINPLFNICILRPHQFSHLFLGSPPAPRPMCSHVWLFTFTVCPSLSLWFVSHISVLVPLSHQLLSSHVPQVFPLCSDSLVSLYCVHFLVFVVMISLIPRSCVFDSLVFTCLVPSVSEVSCLGQSQAQFPSFPVSSAKERQGFHHCRSSRADQQPATRVCLHHFPLKNCQVSPPE